MSTELSLGQLSDSLQDLSVETFLTGDQGWTSQQADLDEQVAENLSDEDLDALSLSEYLLTSAQFQIEAYSSSTLVQKTSIFGLGTGLDFNVDVSQLPNGLPVAAKRVNLFTSLSRKNGSTVSDLSRRVRKVLQEIRILKHPPLESCESIISLLGVSWENVNGDFTTPSLVFEYAEFGTLRQYLSRSSSPLSTTEKQLLGLQVGRALLALHGCGICHGDVKLDNVLVVGGPPSKPTAKLADFGSSIIIQPKDSRRTYWGTQVYNAPELRSDQDKQSGSTVSTSLMFACDIFAFGLLLYELIHDGIPYWKSHGTEEPTIEIALKISSFEECGDVGSGATTVAPLRQAVALCLNEQPEQRNDLVPILEAITGESEHFGTGSVQHIEIREEKPLNLIDLADPVTLFTLVNGGGHYKSNRFAPRPPLGVQKIIYSAYQRHSKSTNAVLSAFMHLQLGICYLVGFGVDRNLNHVREHLSLAATSQYPATQPLLVRFQEAYHVPNDQNTLPPLIDEMANRNVEILFDATKQAEYSSPLCKISQVWKETQIESVEIGSELHDAAYFGDFEKAQRLLFQGQSDHIAESGFTALMLACIDGSLRMVDLLLKHGSDLQIKDPDGYTVWHMLIMFHPDDIPSVAALFHKYSKDANLINTYSPAPYSLPEMYDACVGTPLHWAVHSNNLKAIRSLLESGAKTDVKYRGLLSPIELAASLRLHTALEILCSHAKSVSTDLHEEKPFFYLNECHPMRLVFLHGAKLEESTTKTIELLMQYWDIDAMDSRGWTPLLKLCLTNFSEIDTDLALTLLPKAKNHVDGQQYPLGIASILGCTNKYSSNSTLPVDLIKLGVSVDASTSGSSGPGYNALHWAVALQNIAIIQEIVAKNPSLVNSRTASPAGEFPLNIAATQSNSEGLLRTLQTLVKAGADPFAESSEHALTPLGSFISEQEADFDDASFSYLLSLSKGNNFLARNEESRPWTALHLAVDLAASFTILEYFKPLNLLRHVLQFEDMKGLLESRVEAGFTPILIAALHADYATIRVLAEAGADLTVSSYAGSTCMSILLEQSRRPQKQLANQFGKRWDDGAFRAKWRHAAYRAAVYVSDRLAAIPGYAGLVLSKLHIAAYMCYIDEVKRLLESGESSANATVGSRSPSTARQLLEGIIKLSAEKGRPWPEDALAEAQGVIDHLIAMEASEAEPARLLKEARQVRLVVMLWVEEWGREEESLVMCAVLQ